MICSVIGATWFLNDKISEIRQDVAVIKVQVSSLHSAAPGEASGIDQAQYVLVQLPEDDVVARDKRIRDMLIQRGHITE